MRGEREDGREERREGKMQEYRGEEVKKDGCMIDAVGR